ncbi:MAG TPA: LD-carboxypeptidase [Candidatus Scatovivens faecipullorum]|nr:LD-carboxypeptidase [Candidatus Scatovivens faecipullorum]
MIPKKLKSGDEVRVIAPSRSMTILGEDCKKIATERLEALGLKVTFGKYVMEADEDYLIASAQHRAEDLNEAFKDKNVKAILTVIGGFNSNQILDLIDYEAIKENPKIFCGFSDITALSNSIYAKTGLVTYSGPHYSSFGMLKGFEYELEYFKKMFFFDEEFEVVSSKEWSDDLWFIDQENREFIPNDGMFVINEGKAEGEIVGGNLCTLNLLQGTKYMPNIENKILFLEDDNMAGKIFLMEFDRNLQSLIHTPEFKTVKALVLGRAEKDCIMTKEKWIKMIKNKPELKNIPVIAGVDFGHTTPIIAFPIGGKARLEAKDNNIKLFIKG